MNANNGTELRRMVSHMRQTLFDEGYLDDQFVVLEKLQDDESPNFVEEVMTMFCADSFAKIENIEQALEARPIDYDKLYDAILIFKGITSSIGAKKVYTECMQLKEYCTVRHFKGCMIAFENMKQENIVFKEKIETYIDLVRQMHDD